MIDVNIKIEDLFRLISDYEKVEFKPEQEVLINSEIKIKDEHGSWKNVPAMITKECKGLKITFSDGNSVIAAKEHRIFNGFECVFFKDIIVGDSFIKTCGDFVTVVSIENVDDTLFYDVEIDTPTHLYQDSNGFIHHNTEVAKRIAEALQGDSKSLLRFDMAEYMESHAVSKMIGAPPGYEGFEAGGILTNEMRKNPNRIILFDEIEKADPKVFNIFLSILDDGRLSDNVGRVADFSKSIIIMTTNIGQPHFLNTEIDFEEASRLAKIDLDEHFRPEFLNRFQGRENIICYNRLDLNTIEMIVKREIKDVAKAYISEGVEVIVEDCEIEKFCKEKYDPRSGARGLPGFLVSQLEPQITDHILEGYNGRMEFIYKNGKFEVK